MPFQATTFQIERLGVGLVDLDLREASAEDFAAWEDTWLPTLLGQYSASWPWEAEIAASIQQPGRLALAISGESLEALMSLSVRPAREQIMDVLYVEYVQAAPWNERSAGVARRFARLGALLMAVAAQLSQEEGLQGRIALHSKREVEGFYNGLRLRSYGPDPQEDNFVYFEGNEQWANEFLRRGGV
jgi:hypothetical protein